MENKEMEKKLQQLQSNMCREKEERKKSCAYHWKSGQAGPMAIQTRFLSRNKVKSNKVSSGKVKLQLLKEPIQEPVKDPWKHKMTDDGAQDKPRVKEMACGQCETKNKMTELSSESAWTGLDNQDKGILLNGIFNEEESAQSFQEALTQWRNGNDHRREQHAGEALSGLSWHSQF
ncbi:UNVERIFIED_CONTAM: hypothetical protein H355_000779 [Colinus virginianus]|nr:hypothetical protein H355_000779 [Colinus virginianus]